MLSDGDVGDLFLLSVLLKINTMVVFGTEKGHCNFVPRATNHLTVGLKVHNTDP